MATGDTIDPHGFHTNDQGNYPFHSLGNKKKYTIEESIRDLMESYSKVLHCIDIGVGLLSWVLEAVKKSLSPLLRVFDNWTN